MQRIGTPRSASNMTFSYLMALNFLFVFGFFIFEADILLHHAFALAPSNSVVEGPKNFTIPDLPKPRRRRPPRPSSNIGRGSEELPVLVFVRRWLGLLLDLFVDSGILIRPGTRLNSKSAVRANISETFERQFRFDWNAPEINWSSFGTHKFGTVAPWKVHPISGDFSKGTTTGSSLDLRSMSNYVALWVIKWKKSEIFLLEKEFII